MSVAPIDGAQIDRPESSFAALHHITSPMMGGLMGTTKNQSPETEKP
jgi:hypothetical protein